MTDQQHPTHRELPEHIKQALLRGAGGRTDTAGQAWEGRDLSGEGNPLHRFDGDDGAVDPMLDLALEGLVLGMNGEEAVVEALADARVFVPVIAETGETHVGEHGEIEDKEADMALVMISAPDGRKALPVFSTVDRLTDWHPDARPVAVYAPRAALSAAAEDAQLLVLDPGAEITFVVRRPAVWALAQQRTWVPSYRDESLAEPLQAVADMFDEVAGLVLEPGPGVASRTRDGRPVAGGGHGPELGLTVVLEPSVPDDDVATVVGRVQGALADVEHLQEAADSLTLGVRK
ncbi:SseB family protein [Galactobacter sp.]|uniref:SseB family protein n=1 Tax=Galactobacter sp. TaxID=2676125 RepID=UPI0025BDF6BB|nr:SseB family protein [Galactobacter sp.]